jgi:uncharacterized membrane protein
VLAIAVLVFCVLLQRCGATVAVAGAAFWLCNRWTLNLSANGDLEPVPLLLLLLSMVALGRNTLCALLFYSLSLAVKQVAIFLLPLFLVRIWLSSELHRVRRVLLSVVLILSIPLATSAPFLVWNAEGFTKSILFSATRLPEGHFGVPSFDAVVQSNLAPGLIGLPARVPMLLLMGLICLGVLQQKIGMYSGALLVMSTFVDFNSVLFRQYMAWVVPFVPLVLWDRFERAVPARRTHGTTRC